MIEFDDAEAYMGMGGVPRLGLDSTWLAPGKRYRVTVVPADAPKPKPAAWLVTAGTDGDQTVRLREDDAMTLVRQWGGGEVVPLYEHPPAAEDPADEPVGECPLDDCCQSEPCKRWLDVIQAHKGLSDQDIQDAIDLGAAERKGDKPETLAERMHREGWRTVGGGYCLEREVCGDRQCLFADNDVADEMRELETPPAVTVAVARQLHEDGWRTRSEFAHLWRDMSLQPLVVKPDVYEAMREIEAKS